MKIRKMTTSDIAGVSDIELQSFGVTDKENLEKSLKNHDYIYLVADIDGLVVGFICFYIGPETCDVISLAVDRMHRQRGLGILLSKQMIKVAKSKKVNSIFLEVRRSNNSAIGLYKKLGFIEFSLRKKYYDGVEDAIIMRYDFGSEDKLN